MLVGRHRAVARACVDGRPRDAALSSIRLSLGYASVDADVETALTVVPEAVAKLRAAGTST